MERWTCALNLERRVFKREMDRGTIGMPWTPGNKKSQMPSTDKDNDKRVPCMQQRICPRNQIREPRNGLSAPQMEKELEI